ncbi:hypothetical protein Pan161_14360 [Gimesia algae]|uniref:Uncharacterized protein n=1 Tax=Gimesia algae TaxID=2527971 RepID=A0A517V9W8_9PLAN|nr:hypothetical protein Pan161_14360 [Gimesia algae]
MDVMNKTDMPIRDLYQTRYNTQFSEYMTINTRTRNHRLILTQIGFLPYTPSVISITPVWTVRVDS